MINHLFKKIKSRVRLILEIFFYYGTLSFLKKISQSKIRLIYLPSIEYHYPLFQRPQYLALHLSKLKDIFFIYLQASFKFSKKKALEKINDNLYLSKLFRSIPYFIKNSYVMLISGQAITTVYDLKKYRQMGHIIIYDYVDEISLDICGDEKAYCFLKERHEKIKKEQLADLVFCTTKKFVDEFSHYYPKEKIVYVPNAVDIDIFNPKKRYQLPDDLKPIYNQKKVIVGYHGAMAKWLDYDLINQIAKAKPEVNFVFLGAKYDESINQLNAGLPNIFYLGVKDYRQLPAYLKYFDYSWIPFKKGKIAEHTSPLKMYESLAMGKIVLVSESLKECYGYPGVYVFKNNLRFFMQTFDKVIKIKNKAIIFDKIQKELVNHSWQKRTLIIYKKLKKNKDQNGN